MNIILYIIIISDLQTYTYAVKHLNVLKDLL